MRGLTPLLVALLAVAVVAFATPNADAQCYGPNCYATAPQMQSCPGGVCNVGGGTQRSRVVWQPQLQTQEGRWSESWTPVWSILPGRVSYRVRYNWTPESNWQPADRSRRVQPPPRTVSVRYRFR